MKNIFRSVRSTDKKTVSTNGQENHDSETIVDLLDSSSYNSNSSKADSETRSKLFDLLSSFFAQDGNDFKHDDIFDDFELAQETGSERAYKSLLERLYQSNLKFPEFTVVENEKRNGRRFHIKFQENKKDEEGIPTDTTPPKNINMIRSFSLAEEVRELRKEMILYKSMVHRNHSDLKTSVDSLYMQNQDRHSFDENKLADLRAKVYSLYFDFFKKNEIEDAEAEKKMELPEDAFAFIMYKPLGLAGLTAWLVFLIQFSSYTLAIWDDVFPPDLPYKTVPPMNIPLGATAMVHAGQAIAILLTFLVNDGLWESSVQLLNGYNHDLEEAGIKYIWWLLSNILRFTEGLAATFVIFTLIVTSDEIVTLFKDFTAMTFISSLDNVVFLLAAMSVLGKQLKEATEAGDDIVVTRKDLLHVDDTFNLNLKNVTAIFTHSSHGADTTDEDLPHTDKKKNQNFKALKYYFRNPLCVIFCLMSLIIAIWLYIGVVPQRRGDYLCQKIYVHLDDSIKPKLPYYSGVYKIVKPKGLFSGRPEYVEHRKRKQTEETTKMKIKFCAGHKRWILTEKTCDEPVTAQTTVVKNAVQYDLFDTISLWLLPSGNHGDNDFLPTDIGLHCLDKENVPDFRDYICQKIEIDERPIYGRFISTKTWSTEFSILKNETEYAYAYEHPVYFNKTDKEHEFVIYTGRRWGMFSEVNEIAEATKKSFYEDNFHLQDRKHDIVFSFFSDPIDWEKTNRIEPPTNLKWYLSSIRSTEGQRLELNSPSKAVFICSECDESNPCFYEGKCAAKACTCGFGSSGTLCQVLPTGNGKCDTHFNRIEYGFDNGDCCLHSCISKERNKCGRDDTGDFYIGYDDCKDMCEADKECDFSEGQRVQAFNLKSSATNIGDVSKVSLSSNGQIMAVINTQGKGVEVYDRDASQWKSRGDVLDNVENLMEDTIEVVSHENVIQNHGKGYPPATLAMMIKNKKVSTFDWHEYDWKETSRGLSDSDRMNVIQVALRKFGNLLAVLYDNSIFKVFQRDDANSKWSTTRSINFTSCKVFAMSSHGEVYILSNGETVRLYSAKKDNYIEKKSATPIRTVAISASGNHAVVLNGKPFNEGQISLFDITNMYFNQTTTQIRGIPHTETKLNILNEGLFLVVNLHNSPLVSDSEKGIILYEWNGDKWIWEKLSKAYKDLFVTENEMNFAVIPESYDSVSLLEYRVYGKCKGNESDVHITINLDSSSQESLSWELIEITSNGEEIQVLSGGPYPLGSISMEHDICIENQYLADKFEENCFVMKITDIYLDGLSNPGSIGVSYGGKMKKKFYYSNGYQDIKVINGNETCGQNLLDPTSWKKYSFNLHEECMLSNCHWKSYGQVNGIFSDFRLHFRFDSSLNISSAHKLSSDGSILAVSCHDSSRNESNVVKIYKYNDTDQSWTQRGENIRADNASEFFGWAKSLSADGSIIAVSDTLSNTNGTGSGHVYIYAYDRNNTNWTQRGNTIDGTGGPEFGFSVSISADGSIIAVSSRPGKQYRGCSVFVYSYDDEKNEWTTRGKCINVLEDIVVQSTVTQLSLSSNGRFLVVGLSETGSLGMEYSGTVFSFQYSKSTNSWQQRGDKIKGSKRFHSLGYSVSISADGSIIAMSGNTGVPALVYKYTSEKWRQLGDDIPTTGPEGVTTTYLSSNGKILVLGMMNKWRVLHYDSYMGRWFPRHVGTVEQNAESLESRVFWLALSADAVTVAVENKLEESIMFYRLEEIKPSACKSNEANFHFTLTPDEFPEDIFWLLYSARRKVAGSVLPLSIDKEINFELCISKSEPYTFLIYDQYGDGICCDWGKGKFSVEYDNKTILESKNSTFSHHEFKCLSTMNDNADVLEIIFDRESTSETNNEVHYSIMRSGGMKLIDESLVPFPRTFGMCLNKSICWTFASSNSQRAGESYTVTFGDQTFKNNKTDYLISKEKVGNCDNEIIHTCANGEKLFELDLYTDHAPSRISWGFKDSQLTGLKERTSKQLLEFHLCVSLQSNECAMFVLLDSAGYDGTLYDVKFDSESYSGLFQGSVLRKYFGGGNCKRNQTLCNDDQGLFEIGYVSKSSGFYWEIKDVHTNDTLASGGNQEDHKFHHDTVCLPLTKCMELLNRDTEEMSETNIYQVIWNSTSVIHHTMRAINLYINSLQFGLCPGESSYGAS